MDWKLLLSEKRVRELSGGKPSEPDTRTAFERDYGRAVFSTPVRRLQDKTQVFPLEQHDAVRTRLTHSLEVSSVARNLAREVGTWLYVQGICDSQQVHHIETIGATCGLIHDLGNPPFGHAGEEAIQSWFKQKVENEPTRITPSGKIFEDICKFKTKGEFEQNLSDFDLWEGNAQTLRLISRLQVLADEFGINLTSATFSAACKYIAPSHQVEQGSGAKHEWSKPGFFVSEQEIVGLVAKETGTLKARNPLTYLVEASDDIVYSTGDLEDGVKKGLFTWEFLKSELVAALPGPDALLNRLLEEAEKKVGYTRSKDPSDEEVAQAFRTYAIGAMKESASEQFRKSYKLIWDGDYHNELMKDPECTAGPLLKACKTVGLKHVYPSISTLKLELMGRKVIHDLMDIFWEGASQCGTEKEPKCCKKGFPKKAYNLISTNYRKVFEKAIKEGILPEWYCRIQLVTDQIAGMTDTYAITLHKRLMNG